MVAIVSDLSTHSRSDAPATRPWVERFAAGNRKGHAGWLTLQHLTIESFDREEYLLFSAVTDDGKSLDQEACEKLFHCAAVVEPCEEPPAPVRDRLRKEAERHGQARVARSLDGNTRLFAEERERLEKWAEDLELTANQELDDTKAQIKATRRRSEQATTLDEQEAVQSALRELERKQRRQRQQIFAVADQIAERRDDLIEALKRRMTQKATSSPLFTIRWEVV